ncbi:metalloprotease PmbA [Lysobacter pythonis]|uniref:Metalloprotease PmbA n=1 Tax=Solilutibacter pythonis TaxID=2483112 RepID=A0A3M2HN66_9GAMM|nr:metalloprotease PmbA [Lysobacter pythonis]RMH91156.1 metalloprotease PmbA [Lysobacter pythonis]
MTTTTTELAHDDSLARLDRLEASAGRLLDLARRHGASQAEVSCSDAKGLNVGVRMGEVETVESTQDRGIAVTVYFGRKKGSASTGDVREESLAATVEQACAIARHTEEDEAAGLADAALMAKDPREFDAWHPAPLSADEAVERALAAETAGRELDPRIGNSDGASFGGGQSLSVYANSHGFVGRERDTRYTLGCALIAGRGEAMQRDGWYSTALSLDAVEDAASVGRCAAQRALSRLAPRGLPTGALPVIFDAEVARGLIGHYIGAVSGGALYRRASFLCDSVGQRLFPDWFAIEENPFLPRGFRSASFDGEGVATRRSHLVEGGIVRRYVLGSYSARKLGLETTANAGGIHNLDVLANAGDLASIIRGQSRALYVTELMGQGVNSITGDYSRGAAGFMIENGEIAYPVDGVTIAGNLRAMFGAIEAVGTDVDPRSHVRTGSILVGGMTVAGR